MSLASQNKKKIQHHISCRFLYSWLHRCWEARSFLLHPGKFFFILVHNCKLKSLLSSLSATCFVIDTFWPNVSIIFILVCFCPCVSRHRNQQAIFLIFHLLCNILLTVIALSFAELAISIIIICFMHSVIFLILAEILSFALLTAQQHLDLVWFKCPVLTKAY